MEYLSYKIFIGWFISKLCGGGHSHKNKQLINEEVCTYIANSNKCTQFELSKVAKTFKIE